MSQAEFYAKQLSENPLNWILLTVAVYVSMSLFSVNSHSHRKIVELKHPETILIRNFTRKELEEFNGENGKKIYMAVAGKVFDVTSGKSFYGPGGMYGNFAGRDASRGLAKNSFDKEMIKSLSEPIDNLNDLEKDEIESLKEWAAFFEQKYIHIGFLFEDKN
ncbi:hypothetical protein HDU92_003698 [Lobulomyces angularis]|nr:hypothetical protein HDU92_003698 [Lobulomyces angularis]